MLLHTEHSLLSLLSGMEGVVQKHDFFTEMCLMEESNPGNGSKSIYNGRKLRRICLVLDCLTPNDFTNRTQNLVNLQVVIFQNDPFYPQLSQNMTTLISLINVESTLTNFEKIHPPQKNHPSTFSLLIF